MKNFRGMLGQIGAQLAEPATRKHLGNMAQAGLTAQYGGNFGQALGQIRHDESISAYRDAALQEQQAGRKQRKDLAIKQIKSQDHRASLSAALNMAELGSLNAHRANMLDLNKKELGALTSYRDRVNDLRGDRDKMMAAWRSHQMAENWADVIDPNDEFVKMYGPHQRNKITGLVRTPGRADPLTAMMLQQFGGGGQLGSGPPTPPAPGIDDSIY